MSRAELPLLFLHNCECWPWNIPWWQHSAHPAAVSAHRFLVQFLSKPALQCRFPNGALSHTQHNPKLPRALKQGIVTTGRTAANHSFKPETLILILHWKIQKKEQQPLLLLINSAFFSQTWSSLSSSTEINWKWHKSQCNMQSATLSSTLKVYLFFELVWD